MGLMESRRTEATANPAQHQCSSHICKKSTRTSWTILDNVSMKRCAFLSGCVNSSLMPLQLVQNAAAFNWNKTLWAHLFPMHRTSHSSWVKLGGKAPLLWNDLPTESEQTVSTFTSKLKTCLYSKSFSWGTWYRFLVDRPSFDSATV